MRYRLWQENKEKSRLAAQSKKNEQASTIQEVAISHTHNDATNTPTEKIVDDTNQLKDETPSFESVVVKKEDPIPPKIQKKLDQQHPSPTQEQRLKDQKKMEEIRMSVLSFKER